MLESAFNHFNDIKFKSVNGILKFHIIIIFLFLHYDCSWEADTFFSLVTLGLRASISLLSAEPCLFVKFLLPNLNSKKKCLGYFLLLFSITLKCVILWRICILIVYINSIAMCMLFIVFVFISSWKSYTRQSNARRDREYRRGHIIATRFLWISLSHFTRWQ